ncbi:hypothetical protein KW785_03190 [Candidatus Parcubacteria bacterium]|nr:hypothetical protein [Candidatus Parcubacteria bacterium]
MINLETLLKRFTLSLGKDTVAREAVVSCIREVAGFELSAENISIKGDTVIIKTSPAKKNEIKLNEERILRELQLRCHAKISKIFYI